MIYGRFYIICRFHFKMCETPRTSQRRGMFVIQRVCFLQRYSDQLFLFVFLVTFNLVYNKQSSRPTHSLKLVKSYVWRS